MKAAATYPGIADVQAVSGKTLRVRFANGVTKTYDCTPLLAEAPFGPLEDDVLFRQAHADPHGYAVIWNDEIDLAESEIWVNGKVVDEP